MARGHSLADVIEFRGLIEPAIAALAAERITQTELAELGEIFAQQEDTRFHELIGEASRNELLTTLLGVVWDVLRESREQWLQTNTRAHASLDAHRRVLSALTAHDPDAARRAAADHIKAVGEEILRLIGGSKA